MIIQTTHTATLRIFAIPLRDGGPPLWALIDLLEGSTIMISAHMHDAYDYREAAETGPDKPTAR
jgi:hypothetical protein